MYTFNYIFNCYYKGTQQHNTYLFFFFYRNLITENVLINDIIKVYDLFIVILQGCVVMKLLIL